MIQRIQTVYLSLIFCLIVIMLFLPMESSTTFSWVSVVGAGIIILAAILSIVTIFLFKKRKIQIKLCSFILFLLIVCLGIVLFCVITIPSNYPFKDIDSTYSIIILLVAIILDLLAIRGIKKDEKLVRSSRRIRS